MDVKRTLHYTSHLKWVFLFSEIILILYCFIALPEDLVSVIGIIVFIAGIQIGLDSLSDIEKMSKKEQERFRGSKYVNLQIKFIFFGIIVLAMVSLLFLSLKFFGSARNEVLFNEFFILGLNIWALILGLLCLLKSIDDKCAYIKSKIKN